MTTTAIIAGDVAFSRPITGSLMEAIRKGLTFDNPHYINMLRIKKNPRSHPRHILAWTEEIDHIRVPRGFGSHLHIAALAAGSPIRWIDRRGVYPAPYPDRLIGVNLRPYQHRAASAACTVTQGVIVSPTGSGKTITALEIIRRQGQRAVVIVHNRELLRQWREVIQRHLGIQAGVIGDGRWSPGDQVTVAMIQTLASRQEAAVALGQEVGLVLADECHHSPMESFRQVIGLFPAKYRYGFTATAIRRDGLGEMIFRLLGDVVATVEPDEVLNIGGIVPVRIEELHTGMSLSGINPDVHGWTDLITAIILHPDRNALIADVARVVAVDRPTLILTDRVDHAEAVLGMVHGALMIHGGMPKKERQAAMERIPDSRITIGTKNLLGEGVDVSAWSALIMATPISGEVPLRQAIGRVIRPAPGKVDGLVVDLVDSHPFARGASRKRRRVYHAQEWTVGRWE